MPSLRRRQTGRGPAPAQPGPQAERRSAGLGNQGRIEAAQALKNGKEAASGAGNDTGVAQTEGQPLPSLQVSEGSFQKQGLSATVLGKGLHAFRTAWARGDTQKTIFTIIDFTQPSDQKRMYVMDLATGELLFHELVTHGSNSGGRYATKFSNRDSSDQSRLGLSKTAETYDSAKFGGTALRLDGLERGVNDNMRSRAVVMHQAAYATQDAIDTNAQSGDRRLGRSQGCPAMDPKVAGKVIKTIKNGSLVFSYYPDPEYLKKSEYLK